MIKHILVSIRGIADLIVANRRQCRSAVPSLVPAMLLQLALSTSNLAYGNQANPNGLAGPYIDKCYLNPSTWTYEGVPNVAFTPWTIVSHWIQPWRAYQTTVPAAQFIDGVGINYNLLGLNPDVPAQMLAEHGFKRVRIDVGWGALDYATESTLSGGTVTALQEAKKWGFRPLLILNSNQAVPCPFKSSIHTVTTAAAQGATTIQLDATSDLTIGYTGISYLNQYTMNQVLVTAIDPTTNTITLSQPLPVALTAGQKIETNTFKYRPFDAPGDPYYNAQEQAATIAGWNKYVQAVANIAAQTLGTKPGDKDMGFDLEIWNEVTFGSQFLALSLYYGQVPSLTTLATVCGNLITNTAKTATDNPKQFNGVVIEDGFANENCNSLAEAEPERIGALGKHLYPQILNFPQQQSGNIMLNQLLQLEAPTPFPFVPSYNTFIPESFATFLATPSVIQDLSPFTTLDVYGNPHGENSRTINGKVIPCTVFVTETGIQPACAGVVDSNAAMLMKAKGDSRILTFYLNKGATQVDLFAASGSGDWDFGLFSNAFVQYALSNSNYPSSDTPYVSPALTLIGNIVSQMQVNLDPSLKSSKTRNIEVTNIESPDTYIQFTGNGTSAYPNGFDRERFVFLPFQSNAHRFVIPYYVMTANIATPMNSPETFSVGISGIKTQGATITAYDPLNNTAVPLSIHSEKTNRLNLKLPAIDYPYLLIIQEAND